jgi:hypothetical protein
MILTVSGRLFKPAGEKPSNESERVKSLEIIMHARERRKRAAALYSLKHIHEYDSVLTITFTPRP